MKQFCLGIIVAIGLTLPAFAFDGRYSPAYDTPAFKPAPLDLPPDLMAQANPGGRTQGVDPLIGTWKFNPEKSTSVGMSFPKNWTLTWTGEGQNFTNTAEGVDDQGPFKVVLRHIYDGMPHPTTGTADYDSTAYTRIGNTINAVRFKNGKIVIVGQGVIVPGKSYTFREEGVTANGQSYYRVVVFDRQ